MKLLFFDTETNGLPKNYQASYEDIENWPRVISLAWLLADLEGNTIGERYDVIKPDDWTIPAEKFWIENGYSTEKSMEIGVPMAGVMEAFIEAKQQADILVAHNLSFDHRIMWAEILRAGLEPKRGMHKICTMQKSTQYCKIPQVNGRGGYKWPKLEELHHTLFNCGFEGAHDALADVQACKKCFFELLKLNVIALPETAAAE